MRFLTLATIFVCSAAVALGASVAGTHVEGTYVEARTADVYTGPCFANGEAGIVGKRAVFGWQIEKGTWKGITLDGLGVVGVVKASDTLGYTLGNPYPVKSVLIIDEEADLDQRTALKDFARRMAGDLLQDIVQVEYRPVELTVANGNLHSAVATLTAGELAKIQTRALNGSDHICTNEEVWYEPLTKLAHAMPAYTTAHAFRGTGLNTTWSTPEQRSAFVGHFHFQD